MVKVMLQIRALIISTHVNMETSDQACNCTYIAYWKTPHRKLLFVKKLNNNILNSSAYVWLG